MTERSFPPGFLWGAAHAGHQVEGEGAVGQGGEQLRVELGLAPVVTLNHFTAPHWFAMRSGWLDPEAPTLFARYCDEVVERFGDRIAYAVTLNEPNLAHLLTWFPMPDFVEELDRATLAGHVAARAAIKARRPELPVGFSLAIMDDVVVGDDPSVRDRKRAEVFQRWLELARGDDFLGVQNYEQVPFDGNGVVPPPGARRSARRRC